MRLPGVGNGFHLCIGQGAAVDNLLRDVGLIGDIRRFDSGHRGGFDQAGRVFSRAPGMDLGRGIGFVEIIRESRLLFEFYRNAGAV